jgi:selenocysteine lyase/cysteine desulfurase
VHVPCAPDGYIPLENFAKAIDERTQLVAITHVCFRNGAKLDIPGIGDVHPCHGHEVNLSQSLR